MPPPLNVPRLSVANVTVPVGVDPLPVPVSVTTAVHVVLAPTMTVAGEQLSVVDVGRGTTLTVAVPLDGACAPSPPYEAVIWCEPVPTAVGVYVAEHEAVAPLPEREQLAPPLNVPDPLEVKLTVPVGVDEAPVLVSVTVTVQVVLSPTVTDAGEQLTSVVVERWFTVTTAEPLDRACAPSPLYVPVMVCVPVPRSVGMYVTEHEDEPPDPARVQLPPPLNVPAPSKVNVMVPVGVTGVPGPVSFTVAVQVVGWPTAIVDGEQLTAVAVERRFTITVVVPVDPACVLSPP